MPPARTDTAQLCDTGFGYALELPRTANAPREEVVSVRSREEVWHAGRLAARESARRYGSRGGGDGASGLESREPMETKWDDEGVDAERFTGAGDNPHSRRVVVVVVLPYRSSVPPDFSNS